LQEQGTIIIFKDLHPDKKMENPSVFENSKEKFDHYFLFTF